MTTSSTEGLSQLNAHSHGWQSAFLTMLPTIRRHLRYRFLGFNDDDAREEAMQEAQCNACVAFARLASQGRTHVATPTSLARFAARQYWAGRRIGAPLNIHDVCAAHCQRRKDVRVRPLVRWHAEGGWREMLVEDRTASPADLAASRIDFSAFMASLGRRTRQIAELLAIGESTNRVADLLGVTAGRVSQIRRELKAAWECFHEPRVEAATA